MKMHLCVSVDGLIQGIADKKTIKQKNELALSFLVKPNTKTEPYVQAFAILCEMKNDGLDYFTSGDCDNQLPDGRCGGHSS